MSSKMHKTWNCTFWHKNKAYPTAKCTYNLFCRCKMRGYL